ncbi:unnamed protein product [Allacma fusca]|uniref:BED-type domain-containing protein n=1 Tax=Allacma fusca TaxID=39272 RepID=A0A8J2P8W2_9HEXA|nr:unnamed protein product [Allacma fusca]
MEGDLEIEVLESTKDRSFKKDELVKLIKSKSGRISLQENRGKSVVWKQFKVVVVDSIAVDFVKCNKCNDIFFWRTRQGTSTLRRHQCKSKPPPFTAPLTTFMKKTTPVPESERVNLNKKIVLGLAKDLRPLQTVQGPGFKMIAQQLINYGSKHGSKNVHDVIYDRSVLKRKSLPSVFDETKSEVIRDIETASSSKYRKLKFVDDGTRKQAYGFLKTNLPANTNNENEGEPICKKPRSDSRFSQFEDDDGHDVSVEIDEVEAYIKATIIIPGMHVLFALLILYEICAMFYN